MSSDRLDGVALVTGGGREPDQEVLGLDGNEPLQQLLEPRGRVLRGASPARGEVGEAHFSGLGIHKVVGM